MPKTVSRTRAGAGRARVVVITDSRDAHLPFVEHHLKRPFIVIDPRNIPQGQPLSYACTTAGLRIIFDGIDLSKVSGVWYRKPRPMSEADVPVPPQFKQYSQTALQRHAGLLLSSLGHARWISDFYAMQRANDKFLQLSVARRLGFNVPSTLITSDATAAQEFIRSHTECIVKPLTVAGATTHVFYTTRLNKQALPELRGLHLAPAIFQQAIDVAYDLRVTVVGEQVFAARILTKQRTAAPGVYDNGYEMSQGNTQIVADATFPRDLARLCVAHVKALGLEYGAIDLVADGKGTIWFLENNPNGQWAFVEDATGQPIGKAIADTLQGI